jgi:hypothetical protein
MTHSGTDRTSRPHDRRLRTLIEPEATFLAQLVDAMRPPARAQTRIASNSASAVYAAIAESPARTWPSASVTRRI